MKNDILYIIIPAYNEEENIKYVIEDWYSIIEQYDGDGKSRLIIIDDGSKDDTHRIMKKYSERLPLFEPITKVNGGHGETVLFGYYYALKQNADYVFQTDSDRQTLPEEFHQFWNQRKEYDMVIGWRKTREDGISRVFVTKILKKVLRICFGVTIIDANTPFRLMGCMTLRKYIQYIPDGFNLSNVILSVIYSKANCKVKYIPITFRQRQGGVNTINIRKIVKIGKQAIKDFRKLDKSWRDFS